MPRFYVQLMPRFMLYLPFLMPRFMLYLLRFMLYVDKAYNKVDKA